MKKNTLEKHSAPKSEKRSGLKRLDLFPRILCLLLALILWLTVVNLTDDKQGDTDGATSPNVKQTV